MAYRDFPLIGKKTVYIGSEVIDPDFLAKEVGTVTITEGTTEIPSQSMTFNLPNGTYDEVTAKITVHIPSARFLGKLFPDLWQKATHNYGEGEENEAGRVVFGAGTCKRHISKPVVIHNVCDDNSANDIWFPAAVIENTAELAFSNDPVDVELQIHPMPNAIGPVVIGEGLLTGPSKYNPDTQKFEPIAGGGKG